MLVPGQRQSCTQTLRRMIYVRILTFSGGGAVSVLVNMLPQTSTYVAGSAAAIALSCRTVRIVRGLNVPTIERYLGTDVIRDMFIALVLFLCAASIVMGTREPWSIGLQLMVWATLSVAVL